MAIPKVQIYIENMVGKIYHVYCDDVERAVITARNIRGIEYASIDSHCRLFITLDPRYEHQDVLDEITDKLTCKPEHNGRKIHLD